MPAVSPRHNCGGEIKLDLTTYNLCVLPLGGARLSGRGRWGGHPFPVFPAACTLTLDSCTLTPLCFPRMHYCTSGRVACAVAEAERRRGHDHGEERAAAADVSILLHARKRTRQTELSCYNQYVLVHSQVRPPAAHAVRIRTAFACNSCSI